MEKYPVDSVFVHKANTSLAIPRVNEKNEPGFCSLVYRVCPLLVPRGDGKRTDPENEAGFFVPFYIVQFFILTETFFLFDIIFSVFITKNI